MSTINDRLAQELAVRTQQVHATVELLDGGATVPFIARYRKEATGGLDDTQLRLLAERLVYLRELDDRRATILDSVRDQGKLTPDLEIQLQKADTKQRLEDLYLPYKPKRRTKGQMAREAGIEPLADHLLKDPQQDPETLAANYLNPEAGYSEVKKVLEGARYILMERFAESAELLGELRAYLGRNGLVRTAVVEERANEGEKFRDYFDYHEPLAQMPSHRALAVFRGLNEGILKCELVPNKNELEDPPEVSIGERKIARHAGIEDRGRAADAWLAKVVRWTWRIKIHASLKLDLFGDLRERAEEEAIRVFGKNLKDLLMAAPAGPKVTMGLDPGFRTGVKVALVDETGKLLHHTTIFPHAPQNRWEEAVRQLAELCRRHRIHLISIGNGTASRETDRLVAEIIRQHPELTVQKVMVSEAGASVYSASELAANEFPDLDVSFRGAVSIARRLQDPLAELVKIEPKAIGVGQYQHDVNQNRLSRALDSVVEDCVNAVGVDVNMASVPLLTHVSGFNKTLAENLVTYRNTHGRFENRNQLKKVPRLGPRAFEQAAGFMRIRNGSMPLDASTVHPEAYPVVRRMAKHCGVAEGQLISNRELVKSLNPANFTDERFGLPTVHDILAELEKPGRDPRPEFKMAQFAEGVETIGDLQQGMVLEGVVTNVTNFGAFVDVGVHQDGLVHISAIANRFIKDPHEVVRAGDIVKVKVMSVEVQRKRISLSMRLDDEPGESGPRRGQAPSRPRQKTESRSAFGSSLDAAIKRRK